MVFTAVSVLKLFVVDFGVSELNFEVHYDECEFKKQRHINALRLSRGNWQTFRIIQVSIYFRISYFKLSDLKFENMRCFESIVQE